MELVVAAVGACRTPVTSRQQIGKVPAHQRQRLALVVGDVLPALARIRLQLQRHVAHFHRGLGLARRQLQVDALPVAHGNRDVLRHRLREALRRSRDRVNAGAQGRELVVSVAAGRYFFDNTRSRVGHADRCSGNDRAAGVADRSHQAAVLILGVRELGTHEEQACQKDGEKTKLSLHAHETKAPVAKGPLKPRKWSVNPSQSVCKIVPTWIPGHPPLPDASSPSMTTPSASQSPLCCWKRRAASSCRPPVARRPSTSPLPNSSTASSPTCACPGSPAPIWPVPSARPRPQALLLAMSATPPPHLDGYDGVLKKPLSPDSLRAALDRAPAPVLATVSTEEDPKGSAVLDPEIFERLRRAIAPDGLEEVFSVFLSDTTERIAVMRRADPDTVRREAHTIKGGASMVGALQIARAAAAIESGIDDPDDRSAQTRRDGSPYPFRRRLSSDRGSKHELPDPVGSSRSPSDRRRPPPRPFASCLPTTIRSFASASATCCRASRASK